MSNQYFKNDNGLLYRISPEGLRGWHFPSGSWIKLPQELYERALGSMESGDGDWLDAAAVNAFLAAR